MILLLLACNGPSGDDTQSPTVTYAADVAPLLTENCVSCHQAGQIGPFALTTYDEVAPLGLSIKDSVVSRRMPPWLAKDDGSCNTYQHSVWMEQEEIDTIVAWVDAGMPEGEGALPEIPEPPAGLEDATHTLAMPNAYAPDFEASADDYRCFILDPGLEHDAYVNAFEVVPGDPEIVHHVIGYVPSSAAALADAYERDDADPGEGYTCFGSALVDSYMVVAWAPGRRVWEYPEGTGVPLEAGMPVIVQMHYNDGGGSQDETEVLLRVQDDVDGVLYPWFMVDSNLNIPAGAEDHVEEQSIRLSQFLGNASFELVAVGPHMHSIGSTLQASLTHEDGSETCLIDVPRWDFNWQFSYDFVEPIAVQGSDTLNLRCSYDASDRETTTHWGDGTGDEMCLLTMYSVF